MSKSSERPLSCVQNTERTASTGKFLLNLCMQVESFPDFFSRFSPCFPSGQSKAFGAGQAHGTKVARVHGGRGALCFCSLGGAKIIVAERAHSQDLAAGRGGRPGRSGREVVEHLQGRRPGPSVRLGRTVHPSVFFPLGLPGRFLFPTLSEPCDRPASGRGNWWAVARFRRT